MTVQKAINHLLDQKMTIKADIKVIEKDENQKNKVLKKMFIDELNMNVEALEMGIEALKFKELMLKDEKLAKKVKRRFKKIEKNGLKAIKELSQAEVHHKIIKGQIIKEQEELK